MTTVVALGGNALIRAGDRGTAAEQAVRLRKTADALAPLLRDGNLVITHGNGPQVGNELLRQERSADEVPPLPLYLAVAQTQAEIGSMIETELGLLPATGLLPAHARRRRGDRPGVRAPDEADRAVLLQRAGSESEASAAGSSSRRPAAAGAGSFPPTPLEIVEADQIRALIAAGTVPVACGGGGIPVVRRGGRLHGVDAVIDKDRASAVLAAELGAERLLILTDVTAVKRGFGTPAEEELRELTAEQAEELLPDLAEGSMRPKVEAAISIARAGGETIITSLDGVEAALRGEAGTKIGP